MGTHIGWWYNWAPTEEGTSANGVDFVSMLWGDGHVDSTDSSRLAEFEALTTTPQWIIGPEEPDCSTTGSASMSVAETATLWNAQMAPKGAAGSLLLSPSMCKQADENGWLKQFQGQISRDFDITNLHINKNSMDGVKADLDYYWNTYNKPMWVSEVSEKRERRISAIQGIFVANYKSFADPLPSSLALTTPTDSHLVPTRARSTRSSTTLSLFSSRTLVSTPTPTRE
jgi:hypothetical protein